MDIRLLIGTNIKRLRNRYGYTQEKLSEISGIDYKYLQRIEGKNPPALKIDTLERIAVGFRVKPEELLKKVLPCAVIKRGHEK
jgi:transcriptional regulator with XRE-family HTH domain